MKDRYNNKNINKKSFYGPKLFNSSYHTNAVLNFKSGVSSNSITKDVNFNSIDIKVLNQEDSIKDSKISQLVNKVSDIVKDVNFDSSDKYLKNIQIKLEKFVIEEEYNYFDRLVEDLSTELSMDPTPNISGDSQITIYIVRK